MLRFSIFICLVVSEIRATFSLSIVQEEFYRKVLTKLYLIKKKVQRINKRTELRMIRVRKENKNSTWVKEGVPKNLQLFILF